MSDPKVVKYVLNTNAKNYTREIPGSISTLYWVLGQSSLLAMTGKKHKKHKSVINKAFKNEQLIKINNITIDCGNRLIEHWKKLTTTENGSYVIVDINQYMKNISLDIIGLLVLGIDFDCVAKDKCNLAKEMQKVISMQCWIHSIVACLMSILNPRLSRIFNTQRLVSGACEMRKYLKKFVNDNFNSTMQLRPGILDFLVGHKFE